jgi:hypothetical protein
LFEIEGQRAAASCILIERVVLDVVREGREREGEVLFNVCVASVLLPLL